MLDLNYVRENLGKLREALDARRFDASALDDFARADEDRRRTIAESDQLNAQRNASSREIGGLMKEGRKEEAEARRAEVSGLKDRIAELDQLRAQTEERMHEILSTLPNIPHSSVPVGADESANTEVRRWVRSRSLTSSLRTTSISAHHSAYSISSVRRRLLPHGLRS